MLISVIVTLYNYKNYIEDNIKSFIEQNFDDSELIIVDDASVDDPYTVISKYVSDNIRYICLDKNYGYSYAKNIGIKASKGKFLVMLDADDMLTKNSLDIRLKKIQKGFDFVHGPCLDLKDGKISKSKMWKQWLETKKYKYVHAQGVMLRKSIHKKIGLYDENMWCKSDREMFARIFNHNFKIGTVSKEVAIYRKHSLQMHKSKKKAKQNDFLQHQLKKIIKRRKIDVSDVEILQ